MSQSLSFADAGRLPIDGDNVAIATRRLDAGTTIRQGGEEFRLPHTVMEGHRFAIESIDPGQPLLSWGLPFAHAIEAIAPGDYVCNAKILNTLKHRRIDFNLPQQPNFRDYMEPYQLDEAGFQPAEQVPQHVTPRTFKGFRRGGQRGVGTRNNIVLLGTSSLTASFVRILEERFRNTPEKFPNIDGVVAVAHTEGGGKATPNNRDFLLRSLAGFMTHSNVGAVLAVDYGSEVIDNASLQGFMRDHGYSVEDVVHEFMTIERDFDSSLDQAAETVERWLPEVNAMQRTDESVSHIKLALQCGGSDAFSGISGNALAGWVAKEVIKNGGGANLAETDELIGAEPYVLKKVRNLDTARSFLQKIETFKERARWHGHSAEGNPSGGNQYRGLYNIALKSIGAARKKDPDVRLDHVIDYAERMDQPGYYFMDSPGNDLESIAGQVASGANLILFITGNGSITNFPFVPTLKFVTTSGRWQMLANEMDVNAGRYQDGMSMDDLGMETFEQALAVASGKRSLGELAGHAQVSIWRDWRQTKPGQVETILDQAEPDGKPLQAKPAAPVELSFKALISERGTSTDRVGLVVPTSLCSGQIAKMLATKLNNQAKGPVSRYVALVHTEGCGAAPGYSQALYLRTVLGHIKHPLVAKALMLEHGCEQTHNDAMHEFLQNEGVDADQLGWASVQLDGGIGSVMDKAADWFRDALAGESTPSEQDADLQQLRLGLTAYGPLADTTAQAMAQLAATVVSAGGLVVVAGNAALWQAPGFRQALLASPDDYVATLGYGQTPEHQGLHLMDAPTDHPVETLTGLAATGVEVMLTHQSGPLLQAHPMVPLLQVSADTKTKQAFGDDLDVSLDSSSNAETACRELLDAVLRVASRELTPKLLARGNTDVQMTRGLLGLSL